MRPITFLISLIILLTTSCATKDFSHKTITAKGESLTATVEVQNFSEIEASQGIVVDYTVGQPVSVSYTVPESLSKYLVVKSKDGQLSCKFQDGVNINLNGHHVIVKVTAPSVSEFEASTGAKINVIGQLNVNTLEIEASSAGTVQMSTVNAKTTDIEANSAGAVSITALKSDITQIETSSSAAVSLTGTLGKVNIDASSSAEVKLGGTCNLINVEAASASTVDASHARIVTGYLSASSGASIKASKATDEPFKISKSSEGSVHIN